MYPDTAIASHIYHTNYVRNSRAIGVLWGCLTLCFAVINCVVFVQPQWIGDTQSSDTAGYFGLYHYCVQEKSADRLDFACSGRFDDFSTILSTAFQASAFFVGFSALIILLCLLCMVLFIFVNTAIVFNICGWFQIVSGVCLFLGCVIYPSGWNNDEVEKVCGKDASKYNVGSCEIRWAYILAIVGIMDAFILAVLAFLLANRQAKLLPETYAASLQQHNGGALLHPQHLQGQQHIKSMDALNGAYIADDASILGSTKRSMTLQPAIHHQHDTLGHDRYSEYSHASKKRGGRGAYQM